MPSVERVKAELQGTDPMETAARQPPSGDPGTDAMRRCIASGRNPLDCLGDLAGGVFNDVRLAIDPSGTFEFLDPDTDVDEDEQNRYSLVWEYTPIQYLQLRSGVRVYDGIPQNELQNRRFGFIELHAFF